MSITLNWHRRHPSDLVQNIYRANAPFDSSSLPSVHATLTAGETTYHDTGSFADGIYYYMIEVVDGASKAYSELISVYYEGPDLNLSIYAKNGFEPETVLGFAGAYYRKDGVDVALDDVLTFSRIGTAWYYDSSGTRVSVSSHQARVGNHRWNGTAWVPSGILIEPLRTNLERNSNSPSLGSSGAVGGTRTTGITGREGGATGTRFVGSGSGFHYIAFSNAQIAYSSGDYYCKTFDLKRRGSQRYVTIVAAGGGFAGNGRNVVFDLLLGTITFEEGGSTAAVGFIQPLGDGWFRCTGVFRASSNLAPPDGYYLALSNAPTAVTPSYTASSADGVYYEAVQIEEGRFPTSLIKTTGSVITRRADDVEIRADAIPAIEGDVTIWLKGSMIYEDTNTGAASTGLSGQCVPFSWRLDSANYVAAQMETATGTGAMYFTQETSSTVHQTNTTASYYGPSYNGETPVNMAATFGAAVNAAVEGTELAEDVAGSIADLSLQPMQLNPVSGAAMNIELITITAADVGSAGRLEMTA